MPRLALYRWGFVPLWLLLTTTIFFRQPMPIDETRYFSVAWEMWLRGDFLVPYLNGATYSHKPPLLFWLFHAGWAVFGVNEWWPKLVGPLAALANLLLTRRLAAKLWPDQTQPALLVPWLLIATLLWTLFATSTMFDMLLGCCVLLAMIGLIDAASGHAFKGWSTFGLAVGLGLLAKGPVIFLHLLPTALLAFYWAEVKPKARWYVHLFLACLFGAIIALSWALPAAAAGGEQYASAILWHQTADRTVGTKIHARGVYWYLMFLPLAIFPWTAWPGIWRSLRWPEILSQSKLRFCLTWLVSSLIVFSLLPSKQLHYLIPLLPAFALLCAGSFKPEYPAARLGFELLPALLIAVTGLMLMLAPIMPGLSKLQWAQTLQPAWGLGLLLIATMLGTWIFRARQASVISLGLACVVVTFLGLICFFRDVGLQYDLRPAAARLRQLNDEKIASAFVGDYQGQLNFLGRLTQALPVIKPGNVAEWLHQHPEGQLLALEGRKPDEAVYIQPHRESWLIFRNAAQAAAKWPDKTR